MNESGYVGANVTRTITTWMEGAVMKLDANDPRLAEIEAQRVRLMHCANMRRIDIHGRREYLANVERREGADARAALEVAFRADWERRHPTGPGAA